jgi:predicted RNA-binding Zn ribbon-like protein
MTGSPVERKEWVDGFLFVGNQLALDFLNTKLILENEPEELLRDAAALERWLIASGIVSSPKNRAMMRAWRDSRQAQAFVQKLIAFRERLRAAILRLEAGSAPTKGFMDELNALLKKYPPRTRIRTVSSYVVLGAFFELQKPEDVWAPIAAAAAELLASAEPFRIRQCESETCVIHFYDTSKKGSRRWCSMNICGNRLKVAAYQRRRRLA